MAKDGWANWWNYYPSAYDSVIICAPCIRIIISKIQTKIKWFDVISVGLCWFLKNWTIPHKMNDTGIKWTIWFLADKKKKGLQGQNYPHKPCFISKYTQKRAKYPYSGNKKAIISISFVSILWFLYGADEGIWTHTELPTGTWNLRVCQFRHIRLFRSFHFYTVRTLTPRQATKLICVFSFFLFLHGENLNTEAGN